MNLPTSNLSHVTHTITLNQSCKFEPDCPSHMGVYKPQSPGFGPHKPSSLASLGLDKLESVAASQAFGSLSLFRGFFGGWAHLRQPRVCAC